MGMKWFLGILLLTLLSPCLRAQIHDHVQIAQQNIPAIVTVNALRKDGSTYTATGFVLTSEGLIATNRHVLQEALYVNLTFSNAAVSGEAVPLTQSDTVDLALLKIQAHNLPHVTLGDSASVQPGQTITVIGNPRRLQNTVTSGIISQLREQKNGTQWFQISAPISPSSSGSPVFNAQGQVIAVAFASLTGAENQNLNFAIPVDYLIQLAANQQILLPTSQMENTLKQHPFLNHVKKSWQILKRLWNRWFNTGSEVLG